MPTYREIYNTWAGGGELRARAVVAVAKYALYLLAEDPGTANHAYRAAWARAVLNGNNAESEVAEIAWMLAGDANLLAQGDAIPDSGAGSLQAAVEAAINTYRITPGA